MHKVMDWIEILYLLRRLRTFDEVVAIVIACMIRSVSSSIVIQ